MSVKMTVESLAGCTISSDLQEIREQLRRRTTENDNAFLLHVESESFPQLSLLVKNNWATLQYLPFEGHPGFVPINAWDIAPKRNLRFRISNSTADDVFIDSKYIIGIDEAEIAAQEFFKDQKLPSSFQWLEL